MSQPLVWDGKTPIRGGAENPAPTASEVRVEVSHTLCERRPLPVGLTATGTILEAGKRSHLTPGTQVVTRSPVLASVLTVPGDSCYIIPDEAEWRLRIPIVADILQSLDQLMPDLGWNCIVTGQDSVATLATGIAANAGARRILCSAPPDASPPAGATGTFVSLSGPTDADLSDVLENSRGPVVCFETTGSATVLQALLNLLPSHACLILAGYGAGDITSINFYQDVHKKNIRVIGAAGGIEARLGERAERLLAKRLPSTESPPVPATLDTLPLASGASFVLRWGR